MNSKKVITKSQEETEYYGFKLGQLLKTLGGAVTVCLYGDLGAGKTALVKGIAKALGIPPRDVGSASFVIVAEYETSPPFNHIDLYRLDREADIEATGIWEYIGNEGISVIEWAERLPEVPGDAVKININYCGDNLREIITEGICV